jgi:hypothetical protein
MAWAGILSMRCGRKRRREEQRTEGTGEPRTRRENKGTKEPVARWAHKGTREQGNKRTKRTKRTKSRGKNSGTNGDKRMRAQSERAQADRTPELGSKTKEQRSAIVPPLFFVCRFFVLYFGFGSGFSLGLGNSTKTVVPLSLIQVQVPFRYDPTIRRTTCCPLRRPAVS